jgi:5-methylcytosine-specific restriction protein A
MASPEAHGFARRQETPRLRGRPLQQARSALFAREPYCRACRAQGRLVLATIRDHIINTAVGGGEGETNIQPLCAACHRAKTGREAVRARG